MPFVPSRKPTTCMVLCVFQGVGSERESTQHQAGGWKMPFVPREPTTCLVLCVFLVLCGSKTKHITPGRWVACLYRAVS